MKVMQPWFDAQCHQMKGKFKSTRRQEGRERVFKMAKKQYQALLQKKQALFDKSLETIRLRTPQEFWAWLKEHPPPPEPSVDAFK